MIDEMKTRLKFKNRSQRYNINRPSPRHRHKYTKYKMCLSIIMVTCIKQHLSTIWSSICKNVKQHWGWIEKKHCLLKKTCILYIFFFIWISNIKMYFLGITFVLFIGHWHLWFYEIFLYGTIILTYLH